MQRPLKLTVIRSPIHIFRRIFGIILRLISEKSFVLLVKLVNNEEDC